MRRVFNPRWLTLESGFQNRLRHACAAAMMHAIMAEDLSEGQLEHLTASQLEGTPPAPGDVSIADGASAVVESLLILEVRGDRATASTSGWCASVVARSRPGHWPLIFRR